MDKLYIASGGNTRTKRAWLEWAKPIFNCARNPKKIKNLVAPPEDLWERMVNVMGLELVASEVSKETWEAMNTYKRTHIDWGYND